jgi:mannan endo-1,4-beta-mannosidase
VKKYSEPAAVQQTQTHTASIFSRAARATIALVLFAGCAQSSVADDDGDPADSFEPDQGEVEIDNEKTLLDPIVTPAPTSEADAGTSRPRADAAVAPTNTVVDAAVPAQPVANSTDASAANNNISTPVDAGTAPTTTAPTTGTTPSNGNRFQVKNGLLYDGCGEEFVMRGVNHPTMYVDRSGTAFPEIARTGANTVRLFWYGGNGVSINELEPAINKAVANGMLPIIEMHDSTCAWKMGPIVEQWLKPEAVALIKKHEKHLIVNIANEASPPNADEFVKVYKDAIKRLRDAGIRTPFIIDGGRCGRDYDLLLNRGKELLDADADHNLIFSAHLYDPMTASQYTSMFAKARAQQLPFIVGEFANKEPPGCGKNIDYASLISEANKAGIGWLAWSWGDNDASKAFNTDCAEFDMTSTFAFDSLGGWGKDVSVNHAASIQKTAKRPYALTHSDMCKQ